MRLDDAIQHLRGSLSDANHDWGCDECKEEHEQLLEWLDDYKQLKSDYADIDNRLRTANTENDELKRLLRLAVDDFDKLANVESCYYPFCGERCPFDCTGGCEEREWKHHDEAMKLLGGADNSKNFDSQN